MLKISAKHDIPKETNAVINGPKTIFKATVTTVAPPNNKRKVNTGWL